jgi:glycosyltransferase involved in cell wall biosynthesis
VTKVACIIPARDEAARIGAVIPVVLASPLVDQLIVVDNASTDGTAEIARRCGARVVECKAIGKYEAMAVGISHVPGAEVLLFLDADLHGLTVEHIDQLLRLVLSGQASMACGTLARPKVLRFILRYWAGLTGQRALRREVWDALPGGEGFEVEPLLNSICRKRRWRILRCDLLGLTHTGKREKFPPSKAIYAYASEGIMAVRAYTRTLRPGWGIDAQD